MIGFGGASGRRGRALFPRSAVPCGADGARAQAVAAARRARRGGAAGAWGRAAAGRVAPGRDDGMSGDTRTGQASPAAGALDGTVVVELGGRIGAGVCGSLLAQLGATVVVVEPRHRGRLPASGGTARSSRPASSAFRWTRPSPRIAICCAICRALRCADRVERRGWRARWISAGWPRGREDRVRRDRLRADRAARRTAGLGVADPGAVGDHRDDRHGGRCAGADPAADRGVHDGRVCRGIRHRSAARARRVRRRPGDRHGALRLRVLGDGDVPAAAAGGEQGADPARRQPPRHDRAVERLQGARRLDPDLRRQRCAVAAPVRDHGPVRT